MLNKNPIDMPVFAAGMLIGGKRTMDGHRIEVRNPAHPEELVGTIVQCTPDDVNLAIAAAKAAQPAWAAKTFTERAEILARMLDQIDDDVDSRAILFTRENGKPLADSANEILSIAPRGRLTLELAAELDAPHEMPAPNGCTTIHYLPFGVVIAIVPWNSPITLAAAQIIPALLAGNSVVLKVPESCPLALTLTAELMGRALPPGLLNIISGLPADIGDTLTLHPDVDKIAFTGSVPSARKIMANAAQTIKSITAELGGNDAAIVLEDADLGDETMNRMATIVYRMSGQICMAIKRIYVPDSIHDEFFAAFSRAADRIVVGDGRTPGVTMGPLHTKQAQQRALELVADAERRGATVRRLGKIQDDATFAEGYFMRPTLVTEVGDDAPLVTEEQFCPAVPVARYRDVEEALVRANSSIYGLGGSVWGKNIDEAVTLARRIQAGTVFVNTHGTRSINHKAPYGGLKQSGVGRRSGIEGLREYMQIQTLTTFDTRTRRHVP
jgi:acyl-CoA reductase-like NAD-dependent aldehyde dehydrogenase